MGGRTNANPGRHRCEPTICKFQVQLTHPAACGYEPTVDWCEVSRTCQAPAVVTTAHTPANQATVHCWISPTEDSCVSLPRFASSQQTPCQDSQGATKHIRPRMCRQRRPRESTYCCLGRTARCKLRAALNAPRALQGPCAPCFTNRIAWMAHVVQMVDRSYDARCLWHYTPHRARGVAGYGRLRVCHGQDRGTRLWCLRHH